MKKSSYIELGATLFVPAIHKDLLQIVNGEKYPKLRSVVVDSEDGVDKKNLLSAIQSIKNLLLELKNGNCLVFIRPKNVDVLKQLLEFDGISKIDGFILPKFSLSNAHEYLKTIGTNYAIMPSIEGEELFNQQELFKLRDILLHYKEQVIIVRFGLEDMLRQLGMRRTCEQSIFDISATFSVLGNFIATFKSAGFFVSGGVYPCFEDFKGFEKDVKRDMQEGLFSKTIIHPNQIDIINKFYQVTWEEFNEACEIYGNSSAIFKQNGKMAERDTMTPYSKEIIKRAEVYGIKD